MPEGHASFPPTECADKLMAVLLSAYRDEWRDTMLPLPAVRFGCFVRLSCRVPMGCLFFKNGEKTPYHDLLKFFWRRVFDQGFPYPEFRRKPRNASLTLKDFKPHGFFPFSLVVARFSMSATSSSRSTVIRFRSMLIESISTYLRNVLNSCNYFF